MRYAFCYPALITCDVHQKNIYIIFALYQLYARQKESSLKDDFYEYNVVFLDLLKRFSVRKN